MGICGSEEKVKPREESDNYFSVNILWKTNLFFFSFSVLEYK